MLESMEVPENCQAGIRASPRKRWQECAEEKFLTQLVREPGKASTGPAVGKQRRTGGGCDGWWPPGSQGSWNDRDFDSQKSKEKDPQDCCVGHLEGRLWPS